MGHWQFPQLTESSWLVLSHKWAKDLYAFTGNDEDGDFFVVNMRTGNRVRTIGVSGHALVDPESADFDPISLKVWLGDLGDNNAQRDNIVLYSIAEASLGSSGSKKWNRYVFQYPGGTAHNSETLIIWPSGKKQIVTKEAKGLVFDVPAKPSQNSTNKMTKSHGADSRLDFVSDAVASPDGRFAFVIRKDHNSTISVFSNKWGFVKNFSMPGMTKPEGLGIERDGKHLWVCDDNGGTGGKFQRVEIPKAYQPKAPSKPPSTPGTPTPTPAPTTPRPVVTAPMSPCAG